MSDFHKSNSMTTPNWQHNSGKDAKRILKPRALKSAKQRLQALKRQLLNRPPKHS